MDALVYEDTPLATYFEAEAGDHAIPYQLPRDVTPPHTPFAPTGLPQFKNRLKKIRRSGKTVSHTSTEQLVERFRYVIVASQLLSDEAGPRAVASVNDLSDLSTISTTGAATTATLSFLAAWALHWLKTRRRQFKTASWVDVGIYTLGIFIISAGATLLAQHQYARFIQKSAVHTLSKWVTESHSFDVTATSTVRFIQEVEVVARGYDLSTPLPPVSRLEDRQTIQRCRTLRTELAGSLKLLIVLLVECHNAIQPFVNPRDVQRYHDIYEISLVEYSQAVELVNDHSEFAQDSLKELRFSLRLHTIARRVFLCDLLAIGQTTTRTRLQQWRSILRIVREIAAETTSRQQSLSQVLSVEEWGAQHKRFSQSSAASLSQSDHSLATPESQTLKTQTRRLDDISTSIRALNAKMHVLKEEVHGLTSANSDDAVVSSALQKHYESVGLDIRNLLLEWERGRNTMLLNVDVERASTAQYSRSSSSIYSPCSPSPSVGHGLTIVDGGPAEALRLLNGDMDYHDVHTPLRRSFGIDHDEEVFEAMSKPYARGKRASLSGMSREEKMAKLQEDRRKRATLNEQADNTTNMLRELRMVIKHRPGASVSGPVASPGANGEEPLKRVISM